MCVWRLHGRSEAYVGFDGVHKEELKVNLRVGRVSTAERVREIVKKGRVGKLPVRE